MPQMTTVLDRMLRGTSDANIRFSALYGLLGKLSFEERARGDHHILDRADVEEIPNLNPRGAMAESCQVGVIVKHRLGDADATL